MSAAMQTEVVKQVLSLAQQAVKESHRDRLQAYISAYCRSIPPEVLREVQPQQLLQFVMERFAFLEEDWGTTVKVAFGDPTVTLDHNDAPATVIETRLPDAAFIIRTIKAFLRQQGLSLQFVLHPIHDVVHDGTSIVAIDRGRGTKYSQVYLQVTEIPEEKREQLRADLTRRLELTLLVNQDHKQMAAHLDEVRAFCAKTSLVAGAHALEAAEAVELIDWLKEDNYVLCGYGYYAYTTGTNAANGLSNGQVAEPISTKATLSGSIPRGTWKPQHELGLFHAPDHKVLDEVIGEIVSTRRTRDELYSFYRTDYMSVVRSVAQLRYFGVAALDADGKIIGEHVFIGLISTKGLKTPNRRVPVIASKIKAVMSALEDQPGSYSYAKVHAILDSIPVEDLFYWNDTEIGEVVDQLRLIESKDQARVLVLRRQGGRRISVVCVVPRMRFSEELRERLSIAIRKFFSVPHLREYRAETDDESPIRMHFTLGKYRPGIGDAELEQLRGQLELLLENWDDRLRRLIFKKYRPIQRATGSSSAIYMTSVASAPDIWSRYAMRFPESYKGVPPEIAVQDIALMEKLDESGEPLRVGLTSIGEGAGRHTSLRIASHKELLLNDIVPVLHRMALRTMSRLAERLIPGNGPDTYITGFEVSGVDGRAIADEASQERLGTIVQRVLLGQLLDDRLLGLGVLAGLDYKQIDLLITCRNYLVQVFQSFGTQSVDETLLKHPKFAALLVEYFQTKFSTEHRETAAERSEHLLPPLAAKYEEMLVGVTVIQEDLILRYFLDVMEATRRTNYYQASRGDRISIKIESGAIEHMPRPCPLYEIYVHAPGVEGLHLRGGKVARGGIRHSDRPDDFRTEVLGLQRTQTLKNTVIVPTGSKGAFVTRRTFATREENAAEAKRQYEIFISGLLDITDNYVGTAIVPPPGVVRYDEDDPYLVVAADKGTAHLSDTANAISVKYKFWLDDAFASGGSAGYDHKVMGITSRGGWTNVERHFREMGIDIRKTSIKVAGVGDMSGDVYGNGMLLNDKLLVVASFNHKHVFIDPTPDAAVSYAERKRLFNTPQTQWSDYKKEAISKGGGVFERAAKEIALSPEAKALLGITAPVVSGPDLVRAILALEVDLMWFGGIGTYVKSSEETHGDVGDKVNDNVRISATELRAKVIGEGANLAITQRGRTEYALRGGRCNTDAIDNSAGVDCSDHEVNLKILLSPLATTGRMTRVERDKLLRELEPDVGLAVVQDNYLQSALLSMEAIRSKQKSGEAFADLLAYLDKHNLNRPAEKVPPDEELRGWLTTGKGLPRNLIAVLVAHTKLDLYDIVSKSRIPELPLFQPLLFSYFPKKIAAEYREQVIHHHLRREIIATQVTNAIINQAGTTLLVQLSKESPLPVDELVVRYFIIDELLGGRALREAIHACDYKVAADDQYAALLAFEEIHRSLLRWWLWNDRNWKLDAEQVPAMKQEFDAATTALGAALDAAGRQEYVTREQEYSAKGFPAPVAHLLAQAPMLKEAFALIAAARATKLGLAAAAPLFHQVGRSLHVDVFDDLLATQVPANAWERRFHTSLEREAAAIRQLGVTKLASEADYTARNKDRIDQLGDSLKMVKQLGGGLVPLFLILEDYRAPW